jgi:two-component system, NtrC family, response regulator GlrR
MSRHVTRPVPSQARSVRLQQLDFCVVSGPDKGKVFSYGSSPIVFGKDASCTAILQDDSVSGRHCEISRRGDEIVVRDLNSTNGVLLDGVRVFEAAVGAGSRLRMGTTELAAKDRGTQEVALSSSARFGDLVGHSSAMRMLFAQLELVCRSDASVLLGGETGTGKTVAAEAIHRQSPRADGPLVIFDCAAASSSVIESELFGHVKGAFTDAQSSREGLAEAANGGTLVLDEVADLPFELQARLLRLIENKELRRVGSNEPIALDVRIIACTHRKLDDVVKAGGFRQDLLYRLNSLEVRLPSLRERLEDLPLLVDRLLAQLGDRRRFDTLPDNDRTLLLAHDWPGNVRELRNAVERLVALSDVSHLNRTLPAREVVTLAPEAPRPFLGLSAAREEAQNEFERRYLRQLMELSEGSISEGARLAEVSRQFLQRILRKHGLR